MTTTTLDPKVVQRNRALEEANRVRYARAAFKREIKADPGCLVPMIVAPEDWLETCEVEELLAALPRFGPARVRKVMDRAGLPLGKRVGTLTFRQRCVLASILTTMLGGNVEAR